MTTMERVEGAVTIDICEAVQRKVLSSVQRKLNSVRDADKFTIFRVPAYVRRSDKLLYEPQMVAIGPYGPHDKPSLRAMEEHKRRYVQDFLSRRNTTIEDCIAEIQEVEPLARLCYFERVELSTEKFVEMLLLDGCFIVEFLIKWNGGDDDGNKFLPMEWSRPTVLVDLLLLENQLPLFVLEKLFKIGGTAATPVDMPERPSLTELLVNLLTTVRVVGLGEEIESSNEKVEGNNRLFEHLLNFLTVSGGDKDFNHLLHCYYHLYVMKPQTDRTTGCTNCGTILKYRLSLSSIFTLLSYVRSKICRSNKKRSPDTSPSTTETSDHNHNQNQNQNQNRQTEPTDSTIYGTILKWLNPSTVFTLVLSNVRSKTSKSNKKRSPGTIPSATELLEAGVTIKKKKNDQNLLSFFLDVTFCPRHGVLEIPFLSVEPSTLPKFSNLVAFEQCGGCKLEEAYMTSYAVFMDCLVNTPEDEAILRQHGILENNLASDKHLALFFNQLSEWLLLDFENHYLAKLFQEVGEYCDSAWHKWRAKLMRDYFSNPWTIISLIAAAVLLILTILQTVYSIYTYYHAS